MYRRSFRDGMPVAEAERLREIEARVQVIHERNIRAAAECRRRGGRRRPEIGGDLEPLLEEEKEVK